MTSKILLAAQIFLGLIYFILGGLNGFLNFIPTPDSLPDQVTQFMNGLIASGYLLPFLKGVELVFGFLLVCNLFSVIGLIILAPVTLNIFLFHIFTDPSGFVIALVVLLLHLLAALRHKKYYLPLFKLI